MQPNMKKYEHNQEQNMDSKGKKWMTDKCRDTEELEKKYGSFNLYKKVNEITSMVFRQTSSGTGRGLQ